MSGSKVLGFIRLMRPPNLPTAAADILAGAAISGAALFPYWSPHIGVDLGLLVLATILLYAGGVVLNDVFDYKLDQEERPERPLPSGVIKLGHAALFGGALLISGIVVAFLVHQNSGSIAFVLALSILVYDAVSKKYDFIGPLNMGVCRGLNLLLGMTLFGITGTNWRFALISVLYIFAITLISRGEVHGNNRKNILTAGSLYALVIGSTLFFAGSSGVSMSQISPFLILFAAAIFIPLVKAYQNNTPKNIKSAVIAGVLSLILLDAAMAVGFTNFLYAICILLLLPISLLLSKIFAVT